MKIFLEEKCIFLGFISIRKDTYLVVTRHFCTLKRILKYINVRPTRRRASFSLFAYRFLSGTLVANKSSRRRPELMSSRHPTLIHRRLLAVYAVDLPDNRIRRVKILGSWNKYGKCLCLDVLFFK